MKKLLLAIVLAALSIPAFAQYENGYTDRPTLTIKATDPVGSCTGPQLWINSTSGESFACYNGVWNAFATPGPGITWPLTNDPSPTQISSTTGTEELNVFLVSSIGAGSLSGYNSVTERGTGFSFNNTVANQGATMYAYQNSGLGPQAQAVVVSTGFSATVTDQTQSNISFTLDGSLSGNNFFISTNVADGSKYVQLTQSSSSPAFIITAQGSTDLASFTVNAPGAGSSAVRMDMSGPTSATRVIASVDNLQLWFDTGGGANDTRLRVGSNGLRFETTGTKPTCNASAAGYMWREIGGAGVADTFEACMKSAADTYAWVVIATNP